MTTRDAGLPLPRAAPRPAPHRLRRGARRHALAPRARRAHRGAPPAPAPLRAAGACRCPSSSPTRAGRTTPASTSTTICSAGRCRRRGGARSCARRARALLTRRLDREPPALGDARLRGPRRRQERAAPARPPLHDRRRGGRAAPRGAPRRRARRDRSAGEPAARAAPPPERRRGAWGRALGDALPPPARRRGPAPPRWRAGRPRPARACAGCATPPTARCASRPPTSRCCPGTTRLGWRRTLAFTRLPLAGVAADPLAPTAAPSTTWCSACSPAGCTATCARAATRRAASRSWRWCPSACAAPRRATASATASRGCWCPWRSTRSRRSPASPPPAPSPSA